LRPSLAFSYIGSVSARHSSSGASQTLRRDTRNGITGLSQRAPVIFGWAAITLGIGPHLVLCEMFYRAFLCVDVNAAKLESTVESIMEETSNCSKCFLALIILSSLLTVSLFTIIGLTVGILRIKGKSSCMKGNGFNSCIILYHFLLFTNHFSGPGRAIGLVCVFVSVSVCKL